MQPDLNWLVNPEVFAVGRLPAHSDHRWYQNEAELAQKTMALRQSLNGEWPFAHSPNPAARSADFWKEEADRSAFGRIQVPGHVELQGYGQIQYINTMYPWDGRSDLRPPQIDWNDAPVSSYVRRFDLDPALAGKPVCICLEGVEQAFYLWLNGQFIGYSEDSFTPAHFDLTNAIRPKDNLPYTAQELQNADHREQLPNTGRTVVTVMGAVRGVGGIDSWGADVEPAYRLSAEENHRLEFAIQL